MKWSRNLRLSARALGRSWWRTLLSVSAIAIGIASVVVLIGAGAGAERAVQESLSALGRNMLVINAQRTETGALRGVSRLSTNLTVADWQAIHRDIPDVERLAPAVEQPRLARVGGRTASTRVLGTTAEFRRIRNFPLLAGRFIDRHDVEDRRRVAVVGPLVVEQLFGGELPLGEVLMVGSVPLRIVGVTRKKGVVDGANEDELIIVPLTTAMQRIFDVDYLNRMYAQTASEARVAPARSAIRSLLARRHLESAGVADDFDVIDQTALVRARQRATGSLATLVAGASAVLLGLGGVGLLAVSLLSVRERYGEIGLRLAIGGRPRDVLLQFFTEALMISALGGAAGVALGAAGIAAGATLTRWPMVMSWQAVTLPLAVSCLIAIVFGAYPALRAARLDPIVALQGR